MTPDQWIERHRRAWETADADELVDLFTPGASYQSSVFREPYVGSDAIRQYWQRGAGTQRDVTVRMGWPVITDARVAAEWWTTMTDPDEGEITLPGCLGPCDAAGLAVECETRIGAVELQVYGPGMVA